jgi:F-type H+-transporting ATPase subunit b
VDRVLLFAMKLATEEGGPPDLNPFKVSDFGLYVWVSVAFLAVFILLGKKVFPKLEETLADREHRIKESLETAEETKRQAEKLLEDYRKRVSEVREEANKMIEEGRQTADALRKELVEKAETEARAIVAKAQQQLAGERERVIGQLESQLAQWSTEIAKRIIGKELTPDGHRDLVEQFIREVERQSEGQPT